MADRECIGAHTASTMPYPDFISVNTDLFTVSIEVRHTEGGVTTQAEIVLSAHDFETLMREINGRWANAIKRSQPVV